MGFPNHSFLWAQRTSEKMNLGMGKRKGWWNGWRKGEEHNNQNQTNKPNKMGQTWTGHGHKKANV